MAGNLFGVAGALVSSATGGGNYTSLFGNADEMSAYEKAYTDLKCKLVSCFAAEGDAVETVEDAAALADQASMGGSAEDVATETIKEGGGKKYSFWDWLVFALTILAIITSWTLNNNVDVRAKLGYSGANATAGILVSILCIFAIFMFGPWMYFFFLLVPIWQKIVPVFNTPNGMYWMDGVKRSVADPAVPIDNKFITKYLAMLPTAFESPKAAIGTVPAQFGNFYY